MFKLFEKGSLKYYQIDEFSASGLVKHCFTTRCGGVSDGCYSSLNLRFNCDDLHDNVIENYRIICSQLGVDYKNLVLSKQVHDDKICIVDKSFCGNGIIKPQVFESCDALITAEKNVPIAVFSADCVPVFFLDVNKSIIGLAHSGWKGCVKRIAQKVIYKMQREFSSDPKDILCAIGPSIRACHFEVGDEVSDNFMAEFGNEVLVKKEKFHIDMQRSIVLQLIEAGVPEGNIIDSDICTYCRNDEFFSHRVMGDKRGLQAAIIELS